MGCVSLTGLTVPSEKNLKRLVMSEERYRAMLAVAPHVDWRFELALVLAHETGHKVSAIRPAAVGPIT